MINKIEEEIMQNWGSDTTTPIVSICTITYNHEKFIEEAIDSFLMQETTFPFEIVIDDDCSPDNTVNLIKQYMKRFPNIINVNLRDKNVGASNNFLENIKRAKGKYIALCEGDDYWTNSNKLQIQKDFLEKNEDVSIVHTDFDLLDMKSGKVTKNYYRVQKISFSKKYEKEIYFMDTFMRTMTVFFRKSDIDGYENIHNNNKWKVGDLPLFLYLAKNKKIGFINKATGVYRRSEESASSSKDFNKMLEHFEDTLDVRFFFYNFLKIDNQKIKIKLNHQYHNRVFERAIFEKKYKLVTKEFIYKAKNKQIRKYDLKLIVMPIYLVLRLNKLKKILKGIR